MDGTHFFARLVAGITGCVLRPFGLCLVGMLITLIGNQNQTERFSILANRIHFYIRLLYLILNSLLIKA